MMLKWYPHLVSIGWSKLRTGVRTKSWTAVEKVDKVSTQLHFNSRGKMASNKAQAASVRRTCLSKQPNHASSLSLRHADALVSVSFGSIS